MTHSDMYPFKTRPYAHQQEAWDISKTLHEYALFMEMGTGKSKVVIDTIAYLYDRGRLDSALIVAPKGAYLNWRDNELPTHLPDHVRTKIAVWHAAPRKKELAALSSINDQTDDLKILIINIEAFSTKRGTEFADLFLTCGGVSMVVVDESTTIKNPSATRTKNIIKVTRAAKYKRILTGEPIPRSPLDLYTQCQFLNPHLLGFSSYYTFRNRYAIMVNMNAGMRTFKKVVGFTRLNELADSLKPFSYRCRKDECLDLPDKIYEQRLIELTSEQRKIYKQISDLAVSFYKDKPLSVDNVLTEMLRLHQVTCGHYKADDGTVMEIENNRLKELEAVLEEAPDKVIIWATYLHDIHRIISLIGEKYGKDSYVPYYGAVSSDKRSSAVHEFQNNSECRFFIGNPQTGGMGITLTAGNTVVYYSNSYNLEHRIQSEDRAHRIGQGKPVVYVDLICPGTVDSKIVKALRDKKQVASQIMGDEWKEWLTLS